MTKLDRLAQYKKELDLEWSELSDQIMILTEEKSLKLDPLEKHKLQRQLTNLLSDRSKIEETLADLENGLYVDSADQFDREMLLYKQKIKDDARKRVASPKRIVNYRPPIILENFKNRFKELDDLQKYLEDPAVVLISVIGQAGIGKTALTCRYLGLIEKTFNLGEKELDGIIYLDALTEEITLEKIYLVSTKVLDENSCDYLKEYVSANKKLKSFEFATTLASQYKIGNYLLFIDNFEQCLDDNSKISDEGLYNFFKVVLTIDHGLKIVVASRSRIEIEPLLLQRTRRVQISDGLPITEAIEYLRSLDPHGDFDLRDSSDTILEEIASNVYGIPRALESVVSLLASDLNLTVSELVRKKALFIGNIIENLMEQSYKQLREQEKNVLQVITVFRRPVPFVAVAFILNKLSPDIDVRRSLKWLVYRSFISLDRTSSLYSLHPLIANFIYERTPVEKLIAYEKKAAEFYLEISTLNSNRTSIEDIESQLFAFEHLVSASEYKEAVTLLGLFEEDLRHWGFYRQTIKMREMLNGHLDDIQLNCTNQLRLGVLYAQTHSYAKALPFIQAALVMAQQTGDKKLICEALGNLGMTHFTSGDFVTAMQYFEESFTYAKDIEYLEYQAFLLGCLGNGYRRFGEKEKSLDCFSQSLDINRNLKNKNGETRNYFDLGITSFFGGDLEESLKYYYNALALAEATKHAALESRALRNLAETYIALSEPTKAKDFCEKALAKEKITGIPRDEARILATLGDIYFLLGDLEKALEHHSKAVILADTNNDLDGMIIWRIMYSIDLLCTDQLTDAEQRLTEGLNLCDTLWRKSPNSHIMSRYYAAIAVLAHMLIENKLNAEAIDFSQVTLKLEDAYRADKSVNLSRLVLVVIQKLAELTRYDFSQLMQYLKTKANNQ